ncbi:MAG: DUF4159 domain-containing protein [Planctomycetes bacterium]|nr:DUF4159 domain-containing protein [Planctomycetota bacterium]
MKRFALLVCTVLLALGAAVTAFAQRGRMQRFDTAQFRNGVPTWETDAEFPTDVFTFVRIQYDSYRGPGRWGGGWATDFPDSDLNLSFRLQELTTLKVHPNGKILRLTDDELLNYPFIYFLEPGALGFSEEEVVALRRYLLRGGFLMVDDFWGGDEWANFEREIRRVFPDRAPQELPLDHPIFHCVYDLHEKPQLPSIHHALNGYTFEWRPGPDDGSVAHYRALFDDKGRMMAIICHNTDLGDGWEREGVSESYFNEYSVKRAYPMGINILFYAMTH